MKKISHIEYINQLNEKNIHVEPLEEYNGRKNKILHLCECGNKWMVTPNNVLSGQKCPKCKKNKLHSYHIKNHQNYLDQLSQKKIDVVPLSEYIDARTKIPHMCSKGHIFEASPCNILSRHSKCSICRYEKSRKSNSLTTEEFLSRYANDFNNTIRVIGEYINSKTPIKCLCLLCHQEYETTPAVLRKGCGCPRCSDKRVREKNRFSEEEFYEKYGDVINKNIRIIGKYKTMNDLIECECLICGKIYSTLPYKLAEGMGCKDCARKDNGKRLRKTHDDFVREVELISPNIKILGTYETANDPIKCECLLCGNVWFPIAGALVNQKTGCPICSCSHGEKRIYSWLKVNEINCLPQKSFEDLLGIGGGLLSYDFYLPTFNLLIEYQGGQHESPKGGVFGGEDQFVIQQEHDKRKRDYAISHGYDFLEIWYYDYDNIEQILTDYLHLNKELNSESVETVIDE